MLSTALSCALSGVDGVLVHVETDITGGKFALSIVGLPDATVRESQDRVLPAMRNSGYMFPSSRITVNLAPADIKKEGSAFDLPIALSILAASRQIPPRALENILLFGELSLDGQLNGIRGALPLVLSAKAQGVTEIMLPSDNAREVAAVEGVRIYPAHSLRSISPEKSRSYARNRFPSMKSAASVRQPHTTSGMSKARPVPAVPLKSPPRAVTTC